MKPKIACVAALAVGLAALVAWGGSPPAPVLMLEVATFSATALLYGFSAFRPPPWLRSPHLRGVVCIYLGVGAMFIPASFIVSAFFIGCGTRLVMTDAFEPTVRVSIRRRAGDIAPRPSGEVTR